MGVSVWEAAARGLAFLALGAAYGFVLGVGGVLGLEALAGPWVALAAVAAWVASLAVGLPLGWDWPAWPLVPIAWLAERLLKE